MAGPVALVATATWGPSKPLSVLNDLISRRVKDLGQTAQDAVVATAITCLKSLKNLTRQANPAVGGKPDVKEESGLVPGLKSEGDRSRRVIRVRGGAVREDISRSARWTPAVTANPRELTSFHVFRVNPEHKTRAPYLLVAVDKRDASEYEKYIVRRNKADYAGLAKTALGIAMAKISTKNEPTPTFRKNIEKSKIIAVNIEGANGGKFGVTVHDKLGYSIPALRGGAAAMNVALMKAANKVAGQLAQGLKRIGSFEQPIPTPFPEVKRRR